MRRRFGAISGQGNSRFYRTEKQLLDEIAGAVPPGIVDVTRSTEVPADEPVIAVGEAVLACVP